MLKTIITINLTVMKTHHIIIAAFISAFSFFGCTSKEVLTNPAGLEFRETYENSEIIGSLISANDLLKRKGTAGAADNPLLDILTTRVDAKGQPMSSCVIGLVKGSDTAAVRRFMRMPEIKDLFPADLKLIWSLNPYKYDPSKSSYELHAIKVTTSDGSASLDGTDITSASVVKDQSGSNIKIDLSMNAQGKSKWAKITRENIGKCIAIVVDGRVRSYPRVMSEITGGNIEITGDFTEKEAADLVATLSQSRMVK